MLDSLIESSLRAGANLRPEQKQRAWKSLRARAAAQPMLSPVDAQAPAQSSGFTGWQMLQSAVRWLVWMCMDDGHYERAMRQRMAAVPIALNGEPLFAGAWSANLRQPV